MVTLTQLGADYPKVVSQLVSWMQYLYYLGQNLPQASTTLVQPGSHLSVVKEGAHSTEEPGVDELSRSFPLENNSEYIGAVASVIKHLSGCSEKVGVEVQCGYSLTVW